MKHYEERTYRSLINKDNLTSYNVKIAESDLLISSDTNLTDQAAQSLAKHRHSLETYIKIIPLFKLLCCHSLKTNWRRQLFVICSPNLKYAG